MITSSRLGGFFAAHAIWCVSGGETLIPMLGFTTEAGERNMMRLVANDLAQAVASGKEQLADNTMNAIDAALLYDGRIPVGNEKLDAIIVEMRAYFAPTSEAVIAVPYTPKSAASPFRVHRPKLLAWVDCDDFDQNAAIQSFFEGVDAHDEGSKVWNAALDQSK